MKHLLSLALLLTSFIGTLDAACVWRWNSLTGRADLLCNVGTGTGSGTVSGTPGAIGAFTTATTIGDATALTGIVISGGGIGVNTSIIPQYATGTGVPLSPCTTGRDTHTDTTNGTMHFCPGTNTWKRVSGDSYSAVDTGGDDDYAPTSCAGFPSVYQSGQTVTLQVSFANVGPATLNCGPGAKAIKLPDGTTDPATGAIEVKKPTILQYDSAANGGAGAWILFVDGGITASSSKTLTNTTLDSEGTGNVVTITSQPFIPFATCQNASATLAWQHNASPPAANCYGTNAVKGVADFDASTDESLHDYVALPDGFTGTVDAAIYSFAAATTGTARGGINIDCIANGEDHDPSPTNSTTFAITPSGTTNRLVVTTVTGITVTGCNENELARVRFYRDADGTSGTDDMAGDLRVMGIRLKVRKNK